MRSTNKATTAGMFCSFCKKGKDAVGKLISSPSDSQRAYICDECVSICVSIIEDDKRYAEPEAEALGSSGKFVDHPLAPALLEATER